MKFDELSNKIINSAIEVHKNLGPGFLESVYHRAMEIQLEKDNTSFETEFTFPAQIAGRGYSINVTHGEIVLRAEDGRMNKVRIPLNVSTPIESDIDEFSSYRKSINVSYGLTGIMELG